MKRQAPSPSTLIRTFFGFWILLGWAPPVAAQELPANRLAWTAGALYQVLADRDYPTILLVSALNRMLESGDPSVVGAADPLFSILSQSAIPSRILQQCQATMDPVEGTICSLEALIPLAPPALGRELAQEGARLVSSYLHPGQPMPLGVGRGAAPGGVAAAMDPFQRFAEEALEGAWHLRGEWQAGTLDLRDSYDSILTQVIGLSPASPAQEILAAVPELRSLLADHPVIASLGAGVRAPQAVLREYQSFLTSVSGPLGQTLAAWTDVGESGGAGALAANLSLDWATQRSFAYLASQSATLAGLDRSIADRIRTLGGAAADLNFGASSFGGNLLTLGREVALATLGGNVLAAAANITSFFGGMPGGFGSNSAAEVRAIREGIASLHEELQEDVARLDGRFDDVLDLLDTQFSGLERLVASNGAAIQADLAILHQEVSALGVRMERMEGSLHSYMQAGFDRDYNRTLVRCLEHRERYLPPFDGMGFETFSECLSDLRTRAVRDARDALMTDRTTPLDNTSIAAALSDRSFENLSRRLPLLARAADQRFDYPWVGRGRTLANPLEWAVATQAYLTMLQDWPDHAHAVSPDDLLAIQVVGRELQDALASLLADPRPSASGGILPRVLSEYESHVAMLTAEAEVLAQRHQQAQMRRVPASMILNSMTSDEPGRPRLDVPARIAGSVPQEIRTAAILALGDATLTYRVTLEDFVVRENFRRRFLLFGKRHDRLTSTRARLDVELSFGEAGVVGRYHLEGPLVPRLAEEMSGDQHSERVASARILTADPVGHFLTEIWPSLSLDASSWDGTPVSPHVIQTLETRIEEELRRHGSTAVDNVFRAVCAQRPGLSGPDGESALRIGRLLEGLDGSSALLGAYAHLALPVDSRTNPTLYQALEGPDAILDGAGLCAAFAAGETPLRMVWLEEEPRRRIAGLASALDQILSPVTEPSGLGAVALVDTTLQHLDAAIRMQRVRSVAARTAR